ncbi:MAG: aminomethyl-transferring glycine dehydrogenase subunit GcvPA [Chitinispirillaceae bacterium]|nr:aminomethyl-transferring glycine dehydrogenase subunit GcvPA [Chitinispirillaceae bacterium]
MSFVPHTPQQKEEMLKKCGVSSIEDLFDVIPQKLRTTNFPLPKGKSELEVLSFFEKLGERNFTHLINFVGGGFYDHFIPAAVDAIAGRSEFYTAYTPYQPELSQGTLQAIYEYQTAICRLTEMEVANASLYDGGTALYEACQMAIHTTGRRKIVVDSGVNPIYRKMLTSYTANLSIELVETPVRVNIVDRNTLFKHLDTSTAAVVLQNPNFFGFIDDHSDIVDYCHQYGIITIQSVYPIALAFVKTPGEQGFDITTGEGQSLGIPLSFGGPYLGFMAVKKELVRKMPGRLVARTVDKERREGFVLSLQAREQHIRREKATSNICSNEALCALRALVYLSLVGKEGFKEVAELCFQKAHYAKERISQIKRIKIIEEAPFFNEFVVKLPIDAGDCISKMVDRGIAPGFPLGRYYKGLEDCLLVSVTEKRTKYEIGLLAETLEQILWE